MSMPAETLIVNGKKFMWDGLESRSKEAILDAMQKYKKEGFEVEFREEGESIYLYSRRVVAADGGS